MVWLNYGIAVFDVAERGVTEAVARMERSEIRGRSINFHHLPTRDGFAAAGKPALILRSAPSRASRRMAA